MTGDGRVPNCFYSGSAKVILTDADDVQFWERDPVSTGSGEGQIGDDWNAISIYSINSVVDLDGELYVSITNNNQNNNPATSPENWTLWYLLKSWNINESYDSGDPVVGSDGFLYTSAINDNLGDDPVLKSGDWNDGYRRSDNTEWPSIANNVTDSNHDIDFSTGTILDSTYSRFITLAAEITKQIDSAWTSGDDAGGLFSGTVAINTTYHCFLIIKDSDGSVDAGFDTSISAANIPSGYSAFRRVASTYTDSSANIVQFFQKGDYFGLISNVLDFDTSAPATAPAVIILSVPLDIDKIQAHFVVSISDGGDLSILVGSTLSTLSAPGLTNHTVNVSASSQRAQTFMIKDVNSAGQIRYISSSSSAGYFRIMTEGWTDDRSV